MNLQEILRRLSPLPGPSGYEEQAAQAAEELLRPYVDELRRTRLGSVAGIRRCGRPGAKLMLLDAHLDEVGLIITGHEEGFLRFTQLGGVDPRILPDREITLLTDPPTVGLVACLPPHIQNREEMDRALPLAELYIDVGLSQEEAQRRVPVGTPAVFRADCFPLGEGCLCGKAMDDRACFAVFVELLRRLEGRTLDFDLCVLGSTQEETYSSGAVTAVYGLAPDYCVAFDVTHGSTPDAAGEQTFPLGSGPVIGMGPNCCPWMVRQMQEAAKRLEMPTQLEVMSGASGTNAWPIQVSREGIATAVLSLPLRYMHTPVEVCRVEDMERCARLLEEFLISFREEVLEP